MRSTKGTPHTATLNRSGRMLIVAPREAIVDHVLGASNEIAEGVPLVQILALLLVPVPAHFATTPDVSDGVDYSSVQVRE
eukprot:CAMPEP_0114573562 /NCGR_PEP_ID=MMETSP0114-20121206/18933_1 /TAXON_ID=31324 /ORGANISM="Goniomonas sp, Strain m" /LENGTH=79 /DNA_ID=CAMNT_0001760931 /DNA_START=352 /DNA_END=588 /DNA_ORIENTATION=+